MKLSTIYDSGIVIPVLGLCGISLFLILSTTPELTMDQGISMVIGIGLYILFSSIDFRIWNRFGLVIYGACLIVLMLTFFGPNVRGATRWIDIGTQRFQPSEVIKPFVILLLSILLSRYPPKTIKNIVISLLLFFPFIFMIFKQPDLGNVLVFIVFFVGLEIVAGLPNLYLAASSVMLFVLLPLFWFILKDYQRQRLFSFINPTHDPTGTGYNAIQAIIAIGSGGLFGLGLGKGTQSRLLFLPEYHTDFVFASLGEELGFFGGLVVLVFYIILLFRILKISFQTNDVSGRLLGIGVFWQIFIQVVINVGMNLGLLPITGITLPLLSYGGSSIISTFIALGLVSSLVRYQNTKLLVIR